MAASAAGGPVGPATLLRGRVPPWGLLGSLALAACVAAALWLRLRGLSAEGFADDEVHKWLAASRYLRGDFGGDDLEHPMVMKGLVALAIAALPRSLAPETLTRLPAVIGGTVSVWLTAQLGRRLFGRTAGLLGAALLAVSATAVGYHRIAKEDNLLTPFLLLVAWCLAEAKAAADDGRGAAQRRWELGGAAAFGAMLASKYFLFYFPIPVLAYLWIRRGSTAWRVPPRRWLALTGVAFAVFAALDWVAFRPSTWEYMLRYVRGEHVGGDRGVSESLWFMGRLWCNLAFHWRGATPPWFFGVFAAVKFAAPTVLLAAGGLLLALARRHPAHRLLLAWILIWYLSFLVSGAKYGRLFISVMPVLALLAAGAAVELAGLLARTARLGTAVLPRGVVLAGVALALLAPEARASIVHAPHERLYLGAFGGGDRNLGYFFPHCDYFDAGLREAVAWVAARAEPGAEVASEVDWPVRFYAERAGRADLVSSPILPGRGCRLGRPCYVIAQVGRLYWHNQAALERLSRTTPVHVVPIRGVDAVRVYRLAPGEALFPGTAESAGSR